MARVFKAKDTYKLEVPRKFTAEQLISSEDFPVFCSDASREALQANGLGQVIEKIGKWSGMPVILISRSDIKLDSCIRKMTMDNLGELLHSLNIFINEVCPLPQNNQIAIYGISIVNSILRGDLGSVRVNEVGPYGLIALPDFSISPAEIVSFATGISESGLKISGRLAEGFNLFGLAHEALHIRLDHSQEMIEEAPTSSWQYDKALLHNEAEADQCGILLKHESRTGGFFPETEKALSLVKDWRAVTVLHRNDSDVYATSPFMEELEKIPAAGYALNSLKSIKLKLSRGPWQTGSTPDLTSNALTELEAKGAFSKNPLESIYVRQYLKGVARLQTGYELT